MSLDALSRNISTKLGEEAVKAEFTHKGERVSCYVTVAVSYYLRAILLRQGAIDDLVLDGCLLKSNGEFIDKHPPIYDEVSKWYSILIREGIYI